MEVPKLLLLLCCTYNAFASHHSHIIPIEGYETELQDLGQHVDIPEHPVRVIKITKTIAVKVPVPYPVKVIEKVPYPVHISKPYPVPVPQIIKVPYVVPPKQHGGVNAHEPLQSEHQYNGLQGNSYQVQEAPSHDTSENEHSYSSSPEHQSYGGAASGQNHNFVSNGDEYPSEGGSSGSYDAPPHSFYGAGPNDDSSSFESKSYDQAIKEYLHQNHANTA